MGRELRRELRKQGFRLAPNAKDADIIIAHSSGCYFLPQTNKPQTMLLLGPPHWPGKSMVIRLFQKAWHDMLLVSKESRFGYWLLKLGWNLRYLAHDLPGIMEQWRRTRQHDFTQQSKDGKMIVVRNHYDIFISPDFPQFMSEHPEITYVELPGGHDDCWLHPEPYIALLQSLV
ncbi:MAG TPA: hypothetical protein VLF87_04055 [Patescibacteria group bacterium]|nr:hypothetical protein [Patescibacteria group bacterium]